MWKKLEINEFHYFVRQEFTSESITSTLSDLVNIWEEVIPNGVAIEKFMQCNPTVTAKDEYVLEFITSLAKENDFNLQLKGNNDNKSLKMSSVLIPRMSYEFELMLKPSEAFYREITFPLILYINELKHRENLLYQKLEEKDMEIMEYELDGFKITRKNVITPKFKKEEFENETMQHMEERLKSNISITHHDFIDDFNVFYPTFRSVTKPLSTDLLKQGKILEEKKEVPPEKDVEEVKKPPIKRYGAAANAPIKRSKLSKKRIL